MRGSPATSEADLILEVTGVSASEILRRCASLRVARAGGRPIPNSGPRLVTQSGRTTWRLIDFAEGSDEEFVHVAYASLLCRLPSNAELTRRTADLRAGSSRFDVLVRLTLSPEGRRARDRRVSGFALPTFVAAGRAIELASRVRAVLAPLKSVDRRIGRTVHRGRQPSHKRAS
jgi:hypothetical protein